MDSLVSVAQSQPQRKRTRPGTIEIDSTTFDSFGRLLLATAGQLRLVKAAALRTLLFPSDNPSIKAARAAGSQYGQSAKLRGGSASLPAPHLSIFAALLQTLQADAKVSETFRAQISTVLSSPLNLPRVVSVCKTSKCYDKAKTRLEIAVRPDFNAFLAQCIEVWEGQGASECSGPGPRGPLERSLGSTLFSS
jgi:hypothetical protein